MKCFSACLLILTVLACALCEDECKFKYEYDYYTNDNFFTLDIEVKNVQSNSICLLAYYQDSVLIWTGIVLCHTGNDWTYHNTYYYGPSKSVAVILTILKNSRICSTTTLVEGKNAKTDWSLTDSGRHRRNTHHCEKCLDLRAVGCGNSDVTYMPSTNCSARKYPNLDGRNYYCENDLALESDSTFRWHHQHKDDKSINVLPALRGQSSIYVFNLEKFDNNTQIYVAYIPARSTEEKQSYPFNLVIPENHTFEDSNVTISYYTNTTVVEYDCKSFSNITSDLKMAKISPTGDKISMYFKIVTTEIFEMADNGSILCCVYYTSQENVLKRFVENKTILVYKEELFNGTADSNNGPESTSNLIYLLMCFFLIMLIVAFIIYKKKLCHRKVKVPRQDAQNTHEEPETELYVYPSQLTYAQLDLRSRQNCIVTTDDTPYAEIIGTMVPTSR